MFTTLFEIEWMPDPNTPQNLLPSHLRAGDNRREDTCRKIALRHGIRLLTTKQRQALEMRYNRGLSFRGLATELGISRTAAEKRVKNGQEALRELIEFSLTVQRETARALESD